MDLALSQSSSAVLRPSHRLLDPVPFPVEIPPGATPEQMIRRGGYKRVQDLVYQFPLVPATHQRKADLFLLTFGNKKIEEIENIIRHMQYFTAEPEFLLAFGWKFPGMQLEFPIVALGVKWGQDGGQMNALVLNGFNGERSLGLYLANPDVEHHGSRHFLVRR